MRHAAIQIVSNNSGEFFHAIPTNVVPNTQIYASVNAIVRLKRSGFKFVSEVDGMVYMVKQSVALKEKKDMVLIPETHPLFNAFILYDMSFSTEQVNKALYILIDTCKRVVLGV